MSLVRVNRYGTRGGGRKTLKVKKKKTPVKQEWDNTVHDLTVHRATPEDLIRRHEIHKSKNRALVHWELQEKALKKKLKKQKPDISYLEKRRLSIMKEILSEQYQMQGVLKKSDHMITVAKDLFADFPRKRTAGFPNITMAPDQDSVTQFRGSDTVETQALNEVDNDEEEGTVQSEESENELDNSLVSQSNMTTDRFLHQLKEENSELINKLLTDIQEKISAQSQTTPPETPPTASLSGEQKAALNTTSAVKRIHSKLQPEEPADTLHSNYAVGQVLNSRKQKQLLSKVKRDPPRQKKNPLSASTASADTSSSHASLGIDVLKHMIHDVEREMAEYERRTGREVKGPQSSQGLSGFTLSLVSSLCRLIRYLRESELQLQKEVETRQQMEQVLGEHRELIDALTAEILLLRKESNATQAKLQQHIVSTDEQLTSLTHAINSCPVISNNKEKQASERLAATRRLRDNSEGPVVNTDVSAPLMFRRGEAGEFPQDDLPVKLSQVPNPPESMNLANSFPAHVFEPAVLLTPPRQKSNSEFSPVQDVLRRTVQTRPAPRVPPAAEIIEKEQNWESKTLPTTADFQNANANEENHLFTQRWRFSHMGDLENKTQAPFMNLSHHLSNSHSNTQQLRNSEFSEEPPVLEDGQQLKTNEVLTQRKDIMTRIAELTLQNSAIRAHLNGILPGGEQGNGLQELKKQEAGHTNDMTSTFPPAQPLTPSSMEERIAELNRQSIEARGKLLQLIEQQKLLSLDASSSPLSPVLSPLSSWTDGGKRTIEVSVPGADAPESSKCSNVSLSSGINTRRSSGASNNSVSPLNATSGSGRFTPLNPRAKQLEKQNEEGWFALSTHVS